MKRPKLKLRKVRDRKGRVVRPVRWRWQAVVNGNVIATDHGQGYARKHRAREMGERTLSGEFRDYELDEES